MPLRTIRRWLRPWIAHIERRRLHAADPKLRALYAELAARRRAHRPTKGVLAALQKATTERLRGEMAR